VVKEGTNTRLLVLVGAPKRELKRERQVWKLNNKHQANTKDNDLFHLIFASRQKRNKQKIRKNKLRTPQLRTRN